MHKLTARQAEVLDNIKFYIELNSRPPTRREIADMFDWQSANSAEVHLQALARKGAIFLVPGISRGIEVA